jgi:hypothetical protein
MTDPNFVSVPRAFLQGTQGVAMLITRAVSLRFGLSFTYVLVFYDPLVESVLKHIFTGWRSCSSWTWSHRYSFDRPGFPDRGAAAHRCCGSQSFSRRCVTSLWSRRRSLVLRSFFAMDRPL